MAVTIEPTGKKIGSTTTGAAAGTGLAGAAAVVLVWILTRTGVDVPAEVSAALAVLIGGVGTIIGGKLSPSNQVRTVSEVVAVPQDAPAPEAAAVPDGTGEHRAAAAAGSTVAEPMVVDHDDVAPVVTDTTVEVEA